MKTSQDVGEFCLSLPGTAHVVQWGGADVYKVGSKVFAVVRGDEDATPQVTFKASETSFELLKSEPGLRPAPYMASRGLRWLQWVDDSTLDAAALRDYLTQSHAMAMAGLSRKARLAIEQASARPAT